MSKLGKTWAWWALALALGCGSSAQGTDGSTHWVKCETDADCPDQSCNAGRCGGPAVSAEEHSDAGSLPVNTGSELGSELNGEAPAASEDPASEPSPPPAGPLPESSVSSSGPPEPTASQVPQGPASGGAPLGAACVPGDEYRAGFSGFSKDENSFGDNAHCASNLCLVNYFQGRVTCPYGQGEQQEELCSLPGSDEPVTVPVEAQLEARSPSDAVYCSCRCDGPDPNAEYCDCGDGFICVEMADLVIPGYEDRLGSYCVKADAPRSSDDIIERRCDAATSSCGDASDFSLEALGIEPPSDGEVPTSSITVIFDQLIYSGDEAECLGRSLVAEASPAAPVPCRIFEARRDESSDCEARSRTSLTPSDLEVLREELASVFACESAADCEQFSVCEIPQILAAEEPDAFVSCLTQVESDADGWCLVAPGQGRGDSQLVSECSQPASQRLRLLGTAEPVSGSFLFIGCMG